MNLHNRLKPRFKESQHHRQPRRRGVLLLLDVALIGALRRCGIEEIKLEMMDNETRRAIRAIYDP